MQVRRAAISVTSNIAEGYRRASGADRKHFYTMASGSLYEVKNQLILIKDLGYIRQPDFEKVAEQANLAHKLLNGLIKTHKI
jgi:four helix bundle protein